jgi:hypothetical protein
MYEDSWNLLPLGVLVGECKTLIKHGGFFVKVLYRIMIVTEYYWLIDSSNLYSLNQGIISVLVIVHASYEKEKY